MTMRIFKEAQVTLLQAKGYTVISAPDGEQGYQKAKSHKPDLMLLDVMMTHDSEGSTSRASSRKTRPPGTYPSS